MGHLQHCCSVTLTSYFRHPTSGNEVNVPAAGPRTHVNSDQRVCLNIATMLILSALKTHSYCDDNKEILNIHWTSMKGTEDVNFKTMWLGSNDAEQRAAT